MIAMITEVNLDTEPRHRQAPLALYTSLYYLHKLYHSSVENVQYFFYLSIKDLTLCEVKSLVY